MLVHYKDFTYHTARFFVRQRLRVPLVLLPFAYLASYNMILRIYLTDFAVNCHTWVLPLADGSKRLTC